MNLRDHRDDILMALIKAVDDCIAAQEGCPHLHSPVAFDANIKFTFEGTKDTVRSHPALDFTKAPALTCDCDCHWGAEIYETVPCCGQMGKITRER